MDNVYVLLIGAGLTAAGVVAFRGSKHVAVRAIAAAGFTVGGIMFFIALVDALSGIG
jgi:hypothetical protein